MLRSLPKLFQFNQSVVYGKNSTGTLRKGTIIQQLFPATQARTFAQTAAETERLVTSHWPRKKIETSEIITAEFGADFGNYKVVTSYDPITPNRLLRKIPSHIPTPDYYKTGFPMTQGSPSRGSTKGQPDLKSEEQIKKLRGACQLARVVLNSVLKEAKIGVTTDQLDEFAHNLIIKNGAYPSPLNYRGFPKSICTSVNNVACHGIPDDRKLEDGDIINIDVTVFLNGFHGDCSETVLIGNVDPIGQQLVQVTKECLYEGIAVCRHGVPFQAIGKAIQTHAEEKGFTIVPAFTGHGIGEYFHGPPDIFHFDHSYGGVMETGMSFTIEPILSQGQENIEIQEDGWTAITIDNSRTAQFEHTVLINALGAEILTQVN